MLRLLPSPTGNVRALKLRRKRQWNPFPYATPVVCLECVFYENFRARGDNEDGEQFRESPFIRRYRPKLLAGPSY
jgi:hypothetical protein